MTINVAKLPTDAVKHPGKVKVRTAFLANLPEPRGFSWVDPNEALTLEAQKLLDPAWLAQQETVEQSAAAEAAPAELRDDLPTLPADAPDNVALDKDAEPAAEAVTDAPAEDAPTAPKSPGRRGAAASPVTGNVEVPLDPDSTSVDLSGDAPDLKVS